MNLFAMSRDARRPGPDINLPDWLTFLRIAQGMLALLILIFSGVAAGKYLLGSDPTYLVTPYPGFGVCWFAFAWTAVYLPVAVFVIPRFPPKIKLIITLVILDGLSALWWLIALALLTTAAVKISVYVDIDHTGSYYGDFKPALDMTWTCAALGAFEFALFVVAVALFVSLALSHNSGGTGTKIAVSNDPTVNLPECPEEAQRELPYSTGGAELSATRSR